MRQRLLLSATVASLLVAAGCKSPAPVAVQPQPTSAIAASQLTGTLATPSVIAVGGGNVIAVGGGNVIATGGGNVIAVGGGNVIATGGGNVIATGGGNYALLQAEGVSEVLLSNATVYLADAAGVPYENATAVTDANGRFTFNDVPAGGTYQVMVDLKLPDGKVFSLKTLAAATEESVAADVDTTSTLVAETFLDGQELADFDNAGFREGLAKAKGKLTKADLPENWTDKAAVRKAASTYGERVREFFAGLRERIRTAVRTGVEDWKTRLKERFRNRLAPKAPATTAPSGEPAQPSSAPTAELKRFKLKLAPGFKALPVPLEIKLIARDAASTEVPLTFGGHDEQPSAELQVHMTYDVWVRSQATGGSFRPRGGGLNVKPDAVEPLEIPFL